MREFAQDDPEWPSAWGYNGFLKRYVAPQGGRPQKARDHIGRADAGQSAGAPIVLEMWGDDVDEEQVDVAEEEAEEAQAALRQLLEHCMFPRRVEALALLELQPGLLNLRWAGGLFWVKDKQAWGNTTALSQAGSGGDLALVLALLERGGDLHARDDANLTALIGAAFFAHPEVCDLLLSRGADLMQKNTDGCTALSRPGAERCRYSPARSQLSSTQEWVGKREKDLRALRLSAKGWKLN